MNVREMVEMLTYHTLEHVKQIEAIRSAPLKTGRGESG